MENYGKAPNTETAFEVTQISYFTSLWEPPLFSSNSLFQRKTFSGSGNSAADKLDRRKFPLVPLNKQTEAFRKQASRLKEGAVRQGNLRTIDNLNLKKKNVHTPAQNIPWHVKIKSSPLTSPASLATHMIQTHHQNLFTINTVEVQFFP